MASDDEPDSDAWRQLTESIDVNAVENYVMPDGEVSTTTYSMLMYASNLNNLKAAQALLEAGADVDFRNNRDTTIMGFMAKAGQLEMAKLCLRYSKSPKNLLEFGNKENWSPLHAAVKHKRWQFVDWLLAEGADPNPGMSSLHPGWTPLHVASRNYDMKSEHLLKKWGALYNVEADSKYFGCGVRPLDVKLQQQQVLHDLDNSCSLVFGQKRRHQQHKALIAIVSIAKFEDQCFEKVDLTARSGAEMDESIRDVFVSVADCKVMTYSNSISENNTFSSFVRQVQGQLRADDSFELLIWIVSSHGGIDKHGEFFYDYNKQRIYLKQHLIDAFSVDQCPVMESKFAVFLANYCRMPREEAENASPQMSLPKKEGKNSIKKSRLTIKGTQKCKLQFNKSRFKLQIMQIVKPRLYCKGKLF